MSGTHEEFSATTRRIAGAAVAVQEIGHDVVRANRYLAVHGEPNGNFDGVLLQTIRAGFQAVLPSAQSRYFQVADLCLKTSIELNRCAWMYDDTEARNYERLNANMLFPESVDAFDPDTPAPGPARPYPAPSRMAVRTGSNSVTPKPSPRTSARSSRMQPVGSAMSTRRSTC